MSNLLEHSGLHRTDDVGPGLVPLEPLEHSVLVAPREESDVSVTNVTDVAALDPMEHSGVEMRVETMSSCLPRVFTGHPTFNLVRCEEEAPRTDIRDIALRG